MFFRKSYRLGCLLTISLVYVFSPIHPAEAICKLVSRIPVSYKYPEPAGVNDSQGLALQILTGGTGIWLADCEIYVCKETTDSFNTTIIFTPINNKNNLLGGFIPTESYISGFRAVLDGEVNSSSSREKIDPNAYIYFEITKRDESIWSYVVFENKETGFSSIVEFGCVVPETAGHFLEALDPEKLSAIAARL